MTMENLPWKKMYFPLKMGIFQPVMSVFRGDRGLPRIFLIGFGDHPSLSAYLVDPG